MNKAKRNTIIGFAIFAIIYLVYLILLIDNRNKADYITYNASICRDTICKIKLWAKTGIEIEGDKHYYFFPESTTAFKIMEFCNATDNPYKSGYGTAIVEKKEQSNAIYFIVKNDTMLVRMKEYK